MGVVSPTLPSSAARRGRAPLKKGSWRKLSSQAKANDSRAVKSLPILRWFDAVTAANLGVYGHAQNTLYRGILHSRSYARIPRQYRRIFLGRP